MGQFVILLHETPPGAARPTHWDLMIQRGEVLWTWALAKRPEAGQWVDAERLPDHRLAYLDYEGPISGGRGRVTRWDRGEAEQLAAAADIVTARLAGRRLAGRAQLVRLPAGPTAWRFRIDPD